MAVRWNSNAVGFYVIPEVVNILRMMMMMMIIMTMMMMMMMTTVMIGKSDSSKVKVKMHPCTGTEALYRPYSL